MARKSFDANKQVGMDKNYSMREYTPESLVRDLLKLIPFEKSDLVVDAGSGIKKVWFENIPTDNKEEVFLCSSKVEDKQRLVNFLTCKHSFRVIEKRGVLKSILPIVKCYLS